VHVPEFLQDLIKTTVLNALSIQSDTAQVLLNTAHSGHCAMSYSATGFESRFSEISLNFYHLSLYFQS
jgi:hypothetical protein